MTDNENKELDIKKRKFRRNAAVISFVILIIMAAFYMLVGIFVNSEVAQSISEFNSIQVMLSGVFVSVLLGHLGIEYLEK